MDEPLFLGDWFLPDPPDDNDDWFDHIEDHYPPKDPYLESDPLRVAIEASDIETVQKLLREGISPNSYDEVTPLLSVASHCGVAAVVRILLEAGADPNLENGENFTPLMFAAQGGHLAVVQNLISAGANIHAVNDHGEDALSMAAWGGQIEMVEYMLLLTSEKDLQYADYYRKLAYKKRLEREEMEAV